MQTKIIALAVAGLVSGAAFAQTNVTLYGKVAVGLTYEKSDYKKFAGVEEGTWSSSVLGVRGEEGLGNGLKAIFQYEWRVRNDTGTLASGEAYEAKKSTLDVRYSWVGLTGGFGSFKAGRIGTPRDYWGGLTSATGATGMTPFDATSNAFATIKSGERWNNSIAYESPNFSGFQIQAIYSFGEKVNGTKAAAGGYGSTCGATSSSACESASLNDAAKYGLGLKYANGPVSAVAIYQAIVDDDSAKPYGVTSNDGYGAKAWFIGGAYDFKVVKVFANYQRLKANDDGLAFGGTGVGSDKQTMWSLGLTAPVTKQGYVFAEYAQYKDYLKDGIRSKYTGTKKAGSKTKAYSLGYIHNLSKRTSLHAYYSHFDQDTGINTVSGHGTLSKVGITGEDQNVFGLGIVHAF